MLIKDDVELRYVKQFSKAFSFDRLAEHIANAERNFLYPLLGKELYGKLAAYHAGNGFKITDPFFNADFSGDVFKEIKENKNDMAYGILLWYSQFAIVHLGIYLGFEVLNTVSTDAGFKNLDKENGLYKYQENNLKEYYKETGFNGLDRALEIIEMYIDVFTEFKDLLAALKSSIIPDTKTFNKLYYINNSRLIFMRLVPYMETIINLEIAPIMGIENLQYLKDELKKEEPEAKAKEALIYVQNPLAYLATVSLMEETGAELTDRGLFFKGIQAGYGGPEVSVPAPLERIMPVINRNRLTAHNLLDFLRSYMVRTWDGYAPAPPGIHNRDNTGKKTFFA